MILKQIKILKKLGSVTRLIFVFLLPFLVVIPGRADVADKIKFKVDKFTLDNGLVVLVHENHTMPVVSYHQWFRVGSSYESPGHTGLAHFFEHLMFKGTKKYPKGVIDQLIEKNGGSKNAFTNEDYTGYYTNLPSDKLELIIDVESDRMRNLIFDEKEINSEREVVKEERRMRYENSVYGSLFEQIRSVVYKTSPYRWPVIGYMADLNAVKMDEFKDFYNRFYAPNNAVVVVAGDVTLSKVKSLIKEYYGSIPRQELPPFNPTPETEQKSPRFSELRKDLQSITLAMVYPGVPAASPDVFALDLLASSLGAGDSSRLYKRLVYKNRLATQVSASSTNDKLAGEFSIFAALRPGVKSSRVIYLVKSEIEKMKTTLLDSEEMKKLKSQIKLTYVQGLQTMASRAQVLALNEVLFGDYNRLFTDLVSYEHVTAQDIQNVAKKYLDPKKLNIIQLLPNGESQKSARE